MHATSRRAFTLLELLVSVAVIGILAGIVVTAINPQETFIAANNAGRDVAVKTIRDAVYQYIIDTEIIPEGLAATPKAICNPYHGSPTNCVDLSVLVEENYLTELPIDAAVLVGEDIPETTGFEIAIDSKGMIAASSPHYNEAPNTDGGGGEEGEPATLYWTEWAYGDSRIRRMDVSDLVAEDFLLPSDGVDGPNDIIYSEADDRLYWTNTYDISSIRPDGTDQEVVLTTDLFPMWLDVNEAADTIYWLTYDNPEGLYVQKTLIAAPTTERAFHVSGSFWQSHRVRAGDDGKIYWIESAQYIFRANPDGSAMESIATVDVIAPIGLYFDKTAHKIYWADHVANTIERANPDGTDRETIVSDVSDIIYRPTSITVDEANRKVYWINNHQTMYRADADGSNGNIELVFSGTENLAGLEIVPGPMEIIPAL